MRYFYPTSIGTCSGISLRLLRLSCSMPCFEPHEKLPRSLRASHSWSTLRNRGSTTGTLHSWSRSNVSRSINLSSGGVVRIFMVKAQCGGCCIDTGLIFSRWSVSSWPRIQNSPPGVLLEIQTNVLGGAEEGMECVASEGVPLVCRNEPKGNSTT